MLSPQAAQRPRDYGLDNTKLRRNWNKLEIRTFSRFWVPGTLPSGFILEDSGLLMTKTERSPIHVELGGA